MAKRDYYAVLGVDRDASEADIKKAYRRLAMKYHPDRNPDDASADQKFKEASEAAEVLTNQEKRAAYDQFGHAGLEAGGMGGANFNGSVTDIFSQIFGEGGLGSIFGAAGGARQAQRRGADLRYTLALDLAQAVRGDTVEIDVRVLADCAECDGSGARAGSRPSTCPDCSGAGKVRVSQGFFSLQQTCRRCGGEGQIIADPCRRCRGQGRVEKPKTLSVRIPAGVDEGDRIRLAGEGEAGPRGAPAGDLYVEVSVREHPIFQRDGKHLFCEIPVSFVDAVLGGDLEVPTLSGPVKLRVPPETQTGKLFRLRGKGVTPVRGGGVGDLLCRVVVETPVNLREEQKSLLREFKLSLEGRSERHSPKEEGWFRGVKDFFESLRS